MKRSKYSYAPIVSILKQAEGGGPVSEFCREHGSRAYLQGLQTFEQIGQDPAHSSGQIVAFISIHTRKINLEHTRPVANGNAIFNAQSAHLVDQLCSAGNKTTAHAVQGLHINLIFIAYFNKAHCRTDNSLGDGFCIKGVVLFDFTKGFTN